MRRVVGGAVLLLAFLPALWAQDDKKPDAKTPAEELKALQAEVKTAQEQVRAGFSTAKTEEEKQAVIKKFYAIPQARAKQVLDLAQKNAKEQLSFDAAAWMITNRVTGAEMDAAADLVIKHHAEKLAKLAPALVRSSSSASEKLLKANIEAGKEPKSVAQAKLSLARFHKNRSEAREPVGEPNPEKAKAAAEKLLDEIVAKHADVEEVVEMAKGDLFEMRQLAIGKPVPDIVGEDIDGQKFKLSDYQGKVVMISFWGNWCPPCRALFPHERELVKHHEGKPFALIGVNSDKDREAVKKVVEKEKLNWRSFWNEGSTKGPIAKTWNIQGWPTMYVLDHKGIIRHKWVGSPGDKVLDEAIDKLVAEAVKSK